LYKDLLRGIFSSSRHDVHGEMWRELIDDTTVISINCLDRFHLKPRLLFVLHHRFVPSWRERERGGRTDTTREANSRGEPRLGECEKENNPVSLRTRIRCIESAPRVFINRSRF
jgi:hypothetical protein